jgi:uncharacterized membrane protein
LLSLVDLVVWVTDPQKYADQILHEKYLHRFKRHVATTVIVLNQTDRLPAADVTRCVADLSQLLTADGFPRIPVLAVSAVDHPGIGELVEVLRRAVAQRMAALQRLSADVDDAVAASDHLVGSAIDIDPIQRRTSEELIVALAVVAGVPAATDATERAYRFRARAAMGWPLLRWIRRIRTDPLARLRLGSTNAGLVEASSLPVADGVTQAVAEIAVRRLSDEAAQGLPAPWPDAIVKAGRSHRSALAGALDQAIVGTDLGMDRKPAWWRLIGSLQWAVTLVAVVGGLWLLARIVLIALGLAQIQTPGTGVPGIGQVPYATLALIAGALAGLLLAMLVKPLVTVGARRARRRAQGRLHGAIADIARTQILMPIRDVLRDYAEARRALEDAAR